jgi:transcriptional regulator with XRE-family HTH domain
VTLREWREKTDLSRRELAEQLRTDTATIFRWELPRGHADKRIPTAGFMDRIYQITKGEVSPNDFYDLTPIGQAELPLEPSPTPLFDGASASEDGHQLQAAA